MKKFISVLLCCCILMLPAGCRSSKQITTNEAETMKGAQNYLVLHTPNRNYKIYNYKFTNDSIEGNLRLITPSKPNTINVYTEMNFDIEFNRNTSKFIKLAKSDITKVTYSRFSIENTVLAALGGLGMLAIVAAIVANSLNFNVGLSGLNE